MNLFTEEEAKKNQCPVAALRLDVKSLEGGYCIANRCMAWRKARDANEQARANAEYKRTGFRTPITTGYCGFAGAPYLPMDD